MSKAYICKECNGTGEVIFVRLLPSHKPHAVTTCMRCGGRGWLDWIENVISKPVDRKNWYELTMRRMNEEEIQSKWREVSPGRWEEIAENRRGKGIGLSDKGDNINYGEGGRKDFVS